MSEASSLFLPRTGRPFSGDVWCVPSSLSQTLFLFTPTVVWEAGVRICASFIGSTDERAFGAGLLHFWRRIELEFQALVAHCIVSWWMVGSGLGDYTVDTELGGAWLPMVRFWVRPSCGAIIVGWVVGERLWNRSVYIYL